MTDTTVILSDRRTHPRCSECRRAAMTLFGGNFAEHCRIHATDEELWKLNQAYANRIQQALAQADTCNCVLPEHSCPQCRPQPWDGEEELQF